MVAFLFADVSVAPRVIMWTKNNTDVCLVPKVIVMFLLLIFTIHCFRYLAVLKFSISQTYEVTNLMWLWSCLAEVGVDKYLIVPLLVRLTCTLGLFDLVISILV